MKKNIIFFLGFLAIPQLLFANKITTIQGPGDWLQMWREKKGISGFFSSVTYSNSPFVCTMTSEEKKELAGTISIGQGKCTEDLLKSLNDKIKLKPGNVCRHYAACVQQVLSLLDISSEFKSSFEWWNGNGHSWNELDCDGRHYAMDAFNKILISVE